MTGSKDSVYEGFGSIKLGTGTTPPIPTDTDIETLAIDSIYGTQDILEGQVANTIQTTAQHISVIDFQLTEACVYNTHNTNPSGDELFGRVVFPPYQIVAGDLIKITWKSIFNG